MRRSREEILADVLLLLRSLAEDWEYSSEITQDTYLLADMGFKSLEVVVLGTAVQEHYREILPFPELFAEIGQRELRDISVGEWVDFIYLHLNDIPPHDVENTEKSR